MNQFPNNFSETDEEWKSWFDQKAKEFDKRLKEEGNKAKYEKLKKAYEAFKNHIIREESDITRHSLTHDLKKEYINENSKAALTYDKAEQQAHDLVKDTKAYRDKHIDELRVIQSDITFDKRSRNGRELDEGSKEVVQPLIKLMRTFMNKGYSIDDTKDILAALGFDIDDEYIDLIKKGIRSSMNKKQRMKAQVKAQAQEIKRQETKQYPPKFTTSKPQPIIDMTSTYKPKLNLSHIHQVNQPQSVLPSENTRKPSLNISQSSHHGRDDKLDYSLGQVSGMEADNRIWNSESYNYYKALDKINDRFDELPKKTGIHATNDVRAAIKKLKYGKEIAKRLTSWR